MNESPKIICAEALVLSSTGFSLWGFRVPRPKTNRLKPVLLEMHSMREAAVS